MSNFKFQIPNYKLQTNSNDQNSKRIYLKSQISKVKSTSQKSKVNEIKI